MSDMAAVLLEVMDEEVDAFWCFVGVMDNFGLCDNFNQDQKGMSLQLSNTGMLLRFIDPGTLCL